MRYFLLFTIALCSMNLYSQEALKERRYISEDEDMVHTWGQTPCDYAFVCCLFAGNLLSLQSENNKGIISYGKRKKNM